MNNMFAFLCSPDWGCRDPYNASMGYKSGDRINHVNIHTLKLNFLWEEMSSEKIPDGSVNDDEHIKTAVPLVDKCSELS